MLQNYQNGKRDGIWKYFNRDGSLIKKEIYKESVISSLSWDETVTLEDLDAAGLSVIYHLMNKKRLRLTSQPKLGILIQQILLSLRVLDLPAYGLACDLSF